MKGKFTGVGVGPGDPQLLTLKALHAIQESDVVAIPVSDSGLKKPGENADPKYMQQCTAYQIVRQVYSQSGAKEVIFLPMPMIKDREKLIENHDEDAAFTAEKLNEGKDVVFLTIGDPSIYSTCMYIHKRLKRMGYETELIPGIPSFCAAAARLDISLSENSDELHIIPASYGVEESMRLQGTKVFMKSGRKMAEVKRFLVENALEAKMVENCGYKIWQYDAEAAKNEFKVHDMYTLEHIMLIDHIRKGKVLKVAESVAMSALTAVMARESAYTGKICTWDQMVTSDLNMLPKEMALMNVDLKQYEVPLPGIPYGGDL